jgi:hypothetical protein
MDSWRRGSLYKKPRHCATGASVFQRVLDPTERARRTSRKPIYAPDVPKKKASAKPLRVSGAWPSRLRQPAVLTPLVKRKKGAVIGSGPT